MSEPTDESRPDELTVEQARDLRDAASLAITSFLDGNAKDIDHLRQAEFALKVLDFVTG